METLFRGLSTVFRRRLICSGNFSETKDRESFEHSPRCFMCWDNNPIRVNSLAQKFVSDYELEQSLMPGFPLDLVDNFLFKLAESLGVDNVPPGLHPEIPSGTVCVSCQKMFFSRFHFHRLAGPNNVHELNRCRLRKILTASPELFSYIRSLRISGVNHKLSPEIYSFDQFLLEGLVKHGNGCLRSLSFTTQVWTTLKEVPRSSLVSLMKTCPIDTVAIEVCCPRFLFPLHVLEDVSKLQHLKITHSYCFHNVIVNYQLPCPSSGEMEVVFVKTLHLQGLGAKIMVDCFRNQDSDDRPLEFKSSNLKGLRIDGNSKSDISNMYELLKLGVDTIESLVWDPTEENNYFDIRHMVGLPLQNLSHLTLRYYNKTGLAILKSQMGDPLPRLKMLNIVYNVEMMDCLELIDMKLASVQHAVKIIDSAFNELQFRKKQFPVLQQIGLFLIHEDGGDECPHWDRWMPSIEWPFSSLCAPTMHKTGMLFLRSGPEHEAEVFMEKVLRMESIMLVGEEKTNEDLLYHV